MNLPSPGLFGLYNTNRDFTKKESWGKNQFNSSFPAALCCYLASRDLDAVFLALNNGAIHPKSISIQEVFGIRPDDPDVYFAFEAQHTPYQKYVVDSLPRTDLVTQRQSSGECLSGLEVKLTALPDNTTCESREELYGSEIVIRPDTIVYLACSIASALSSELGDILPTINVLDWREGRNVIDKIDVIVDALDKTISRLEYSQTAFLIQPIWKTIGKNPELANNCLDVFVWSNAGFTKFITNISKNASESTSISRQVRTVIWLYRMLHDIKEHKKFDHERIIDELSYNTKNDKAFASSGAVTHRYMACDRLVKPIVTKDQLKEIILGGGQNLLSPERRFDAIIFNSPGLF